MKIKHKNINEQTVNNGDWGYVLQGEAKILVVVAQVSERKYVLMTFNEDDDTCAKVDRWADPVSTKDHTGIPVNELLTCGDKWIPVDVEIIVE